MTKIDKILKELNDTYYSIRIIDGERVIYGLLNNSTEFEVSGLDNNRKTMSATIYIWSKRPYVERIETIADIHSVSMLADILLELRHRYETENSEA